MGIQQVVRAAQNFIKTHHAIPSSFGSTNKLANTFKQLNIPSVFARDIEQINDKAIRGHLIDYVLANSRNSNDLWRIQEIVQKLNMCTDTRIKNEVECILLNTKSESVQDFRKAFDKVEQILDCVNTMDGKYSSLYRNSSVGNYYNEVIPSLKSRGDKEKINELIDYTHSNTRRLLRTGNSNIDEKTLEYIAKNQDIKEYISTASKNDEITGILYEKYLETQPKEIKYKLEDIFYRFGIHTFVDKGAGKDTLSKLKRLEYELEQQLKTSEGKAEFPNLLDLTKYDAYCFSHSAAGYTYRGGQYHSKITIDDAGCSGIAEVYRHESIHFNDKRVGNEQPTFSEASKNDFLSANLDIDYIQQILGSRAEKIAHSARLDMAKVSQETKEELINDGLNPFYTRIESITEGNRNFLNEQLSIYKKYIESIIEHSKYGANEEFVIDLLKNEDKLDFTTIKYLFERNPEYKFCNVKELLENATEYKENFMKSIQSYFDKTAAEKICNNHYINRNELLDYIAKHTDDKEIINEIVSKKTIIKISDIDLLLECEKAIRANQEWLNKVQHQAK